jgi:hypothetical protein
MGHSGLNTELTQSCLPIYLSLSSRPNRDLLGLKNLGNRCRRYKTKSFHNTKRPDLKLSKGKIAEKPITIVCTRN